jgi:hypothetical protein
VGGSGSDGPNVIDGGDGDAVILIGAAGPPTTCGGARASTP